MLSDRKQHGLRTIGEVASDVGVAATTLRYYEREGILKPAGRTHAGYRLYDDKAVQQLEFIRAAQTVGFTLEDTRALLQLDGRTSCKKVQEVIKRRLVEVDRKLADLKQLRSTLASALGRCRSSNKGCAVLNDLGDARRRKKKL